MESAASPTRLVTFVIRHFLDKVGPLLEVVGDSVANTTAAVGALQAAFEKRGRTSGPQEERKASRADREEPEAQAATSATIE